MQITSVRSISRAYHRGIRGVLTPCATLLALACGDPEPCAEGPYDCARAHDTPATVELGTGDPEGPAFVPMPEDGRLPLHPGPQGGYHVFLQARTRGLCGNRIDFVRQVREPGGAELVRTSQTARIRMVDGGEGTWVFPRAQVTFLCPAEVSGVEMADRPLEVEVTLSEQPECGGGQEPRSISTTAVLVPTCQPGDTLCSTSSDTGCAAR